MPKVKIESIVEHLDYGLKRALEEAVLNVAPQARFDRNELFRAFVRSVGRKCNTWVEVPKTSVEI